MYNNAASLFHGSSTGQKCKKKKTLKRWKRRAIRDTHAVPSNLGPFEVNEQ
jgi:hypothetical protein